MTILGQLRGGLVVSCQPIDGGAMDTPDIIAAMAQAAISGGAVGVRIEGIENLKAVRPTVRAPIIGIVKEHLPDSPVRITPRVVQAQELAKAGADVIAYDGTPRPRVDSREFVLAAILQTGKLAMADCATIADARAALAGGASVTGTTLSGYTEETAGTDSEPDFGLIEHFAGLGGFVMAEGRFNTPHLAALAMQRGADAVTVGSALTRLELMVNKFQAALTTEKT